jgi:putative redox protein
MQLRIKWVENVTFLAETESAHALVMDGAPEGGGRNLGPRPMEMVLLGAGGCSGFDVVLILKRGRHDVRGCDVHLVAERASEDPKVFTKIDMRYTVRGRNLPRAAVERAVQLSHEKYCSASIMLAKTAAMTHSVEVIDEA